jgi:hypothetical protein
LGKFRKYDISQIQKLRKFENSLITFNLEAPCSLRCPDPGYTRDEFRGVAIITVVCAVFSVSLQFFLGASYILIRKKRERGRGRVGGRGEGRGEKDKGKDFDYEYI